MVRCGAVEAERPAVEKGVQAPENVVRGTGVAEGVQNAVTHVHGAVEVDEGLEVETGARREGAGEQRRGRAIGVAEVVLPGEADREVETSDLAKRLQTPRSTDGIPGIYVRADTAEDAVHGQVRVFQVDVEGLEFAEVIPDSRSGDLLARARLTRDDGGQRKGGTAGTLPEDVQGLA